jgi:hypothetical protein
VKKVPLVWTKARQENFNHAGLITHNPPLKSPPPPPLEVVVAGFKEVDVWVVAEGLSFGFKVVFGVVFGGEAPTFLGAAVFLAGAEVVEVVAGVLGSSPPSQPSEPPSPG